MVSQQKTSSSKEILMISNLLHSRPESKHNFKGPHKRGIMVAEKLFPSMFLVTFLSAQTSEKQCFLAEQSKKVSLKAIALRLLRMHNLGKAAHATLEYSDIVSSVRKL